LAKLSGFGQARQTCTLLPRAITRVGSPKKQPPGMQTGDWYQCVIHTYEVRLQSGRVRLLHSIC
jgi:hypothetical protein